MAMRGALSKWTNYVSGWQPRYFILEADRGVLVYYTKARDLENGNPRGSINLKDADIDSTSDDDEWNFAVTSGTQVYHLRAMTEKDFHTWVIALRRIIDLYSGYDSKNSVTQTCSDSSKNLNANSICEQERIVNCSESIRQKISEAEAYRNLLMQHLEDVQSALDVDQKFHSRTDGRLDGGDADDEGSLVISTAVREGALNIRATSSCMLKSLNQCLLMLRKGGKLRSLSQCGRPAANCVGRPSIVESHDGEHDEFHDAVEDLDVMEGAGANDESLIESDSVSSGDDLDETGQKSVILHLLSQLRIGMDLTKVVLPTFILERRSLLEMYADFIAHPDIFAKIPDHDDPYDRMIHVVRWYLSAFHAGRNGSVAKKPYNPILGEIFRCSWDYTNSGSSGAGDTCPVTFIAEQVSHHPPVSAFYAATKDKQVSLNAHIWTKSKFLGTSAGVMNVGQAVLKLGQWGEEYVFTFPNAFARSILTVPWVELGGDVSIECHQTGYYSKIEFLTKPLFGGKTHQVTADVRNRNRSSQSLCKIRGLWNEKMFIKNNDGSEDLFIDTTCLPIVPKHVKPLREQDQFESRRLWKDVTVALKRKDVHQATTFKRKLEDRQRMEKEQRRVAGIQWIPKYFQKDSLNHWVYINDLPATS